MSGARETNGAFDPLVQPFVDFWSDYMKQANDATREFLDGIDDGSDIKTLQRQWFNAVSKSMDAYMRTPMFLQPIKQNMDLVNKTKQRTDDLASEIARNANIPTASDISGLFERLHSVEEGILNRLGHIDKRLQAIEEQIGAGEMASS